jgi:integrase
MNIDNFLSSAFNYAETSKRTYRATIIPILSQVRNPAALCAADLIQLITQSGWGNSRQCVALAAIKKYLAWNYGNHHPALDAKIKRIVGKPQRSLDPETAIKLLASFNTYTAKGARDLAICSLDLDTGLRASELCRLQQSDTDLDKRVLQILVKGGQWKAAIFSAETAEHIRHWMNYRTIADGQGNLFTNIHTGKGLTPEGLNTIVKAWGENIGIKLSPHDMRRSFATLATIMGAPERILMDGGRWSNTDMIVRYTRTLKLETMRRYLPVAGLSSNEYNT